MAIFRARALEAFYELKSNLSFSQISMNQNRRCSSIPLQSQLEIVPTEYRFLTKEVLPTNQFSVTEYYVPMCETDRTWPAVYFFYDLSPSLWQLKKNVAVFCTSSLGFVQYLAAHLPLQECWMAGCIGFLRHLQSGLLEMYSGRRIGIVLLKARGVMRTVLYAQQLS